MLYQYINRGKTQCQTNIGKGERLFYAHKYTRYLIANKGKISLWVHIAVN